MFPCLKLTSEAGTSVCLISGLVFRGRSSYIKFYKILIVVIGGLLAAHLMAHRTDMQVEPGWPCSGKLLELAEDVAKRLLPGTEIVFQNFSFY